MNAAKMALVSLLFVSIVFKNLNAEPPTLCIDGDLKTQLVYEQIPIADKNTSLIVPVTIRHIGKTHSYSFTVQFDKSVVAYDGASKSTGWRTPGFLEENGGSIAAFLVLPEDNTVEIAATLTGNDSLLTVSGNGVVGVLRFTVLNDGDPQLKIIKAKFLDLHGKCIFDIDTKSPAEVIK